MANIAFFVLPFPGSALASLGFANSLREKGHRISYLGMADSEATIRANGFDFSTVFQTHFPKGFFTENQVFSNLPAGLAKLQLARQFLARINAFADDLLGQEGERFCKTLRTLSPNLVVLASTEFYAEWVAFLVNGMGLSCLYFHDSFSSTPDSGLPWIGSSIVPTGRWTSRAQIAVEWQRLKIGASFQLRALSPLGLRLDFNRIMIKFAAKYRYPLKSGDHQLFRRQIPRLIELVPCPVSFEFFDTNMPDRHYIEASLFLDRAGPVFPWDRLNGERPLIYCALGSLLWISKERYLNFFRTVIEVAKLRPDLQWVIATGSPLDPEELAPAPPHVLVVKHAPQLDVLKRAEMMITHGGTNTIKECIYFGVPMIAFPLGFDHPGNTARVVYHGLGYRGDLEKLSVSYLRNLIETIEQSQDVRQRMKTMQAKFRAAEEAKPGLQIVEAMLQGCSIADTSRVGLHRWTETGKTRSHRF